MVRYNIGYAVKCAFVAALLFGSSVLSNAESVNVESFVNSAPLKGAVVGLAIIDMDAETLIAGHDTYLPLVPASLQKLIVTSSVFKCYKPEERFVTGIEYSGTVNGGVLEGSVIVRGCGDPSLGSVFSKQKGDAVFYEILAALRKNGINRINGDIIADDSYFSFQGIQPSWLMEDIGNYFAAGCYGINFSDNLYRLYVKSGAKGSKASVTECRPEIPGMKLNGWFVSEGNGKDSAYITGLPFVNERFLSGRVPINRERYVVKGDIPDPALYFAGRLKAFLSANGISCSGGITTARLAAIDNMRIPERGETTLLCNHYSDRLSDIVSVTNFRSNNLYAESLMRWVGGAKGMTRSVEGGANAVVEIWRGEGVRMDGIKIYDGCGLSLRNRISAGTLASILAAVGRNGEIFDAFLATLPEAGKEGTVKMLLAGTPLAGKVWAKSGSMNGVQCYAGYCCTDRRLAFALIVNGFSSERWEVQREIGKFLYSAFTGE